MPHDSHDDFLKVAIVREKPKKKKGGRPEHGIRGLAIRLPDGTCGLLNFDTGDVDVWIVGERPMPGHMRGCKNKDTNSGLARLGDKRGQSSQGTYQFFGANKIGVSSR